MSVPALDRDAVITQVPCTAALSGQLASIVTLPGARLFEIVTIPRCATFSDQLPQKSVRLSSGALRPCCSAAA